MKRISTKLYGRLGNQMFQIATAWAYATQKSLEFIMPNSTLNEKEWPYYWKGKNTLPFKKISDYEGQFSNADFKEGAAGYNPIPHYTDFLGISFINLITFEGYWQSYKYFEQYREELIKIFKFNEPVKPKIENISTMTAIHVRRGDYVKYADKFPPVTIEYINAAIEYFNCFNQYKFVVFSDDLKWCMDNIKSELSDINFYPQGNEIEDMNAMFQCQSFIISNSTFSWWPAWLSYKNDVRPKKVVAPSIWYGKNNQHIAHNDLLPAGWKII